MSNLPRTMENPVTGEVVTFLVTSAESEGKLVKTRTLLPPHAPGVPRHYHLGYTETFRAVEGQLSMLLGKERRHHLLQSGESFHVPIGYPHRFWNESDEQVIFEADIQPAQHFEDSMRIAFGLAQDGKVTKEGAPSNLWELALSLNLADSYFAELPALPQRLIFSAFAKIATWRGYDPLFSRYTRDTAEGHKQNIS